MTEYKKEVLLVRHGQSETNLTERYQAGNQIESDPLSREGMAQAQLLAAEFEDQDYRPDIIISSAYDRAISTAQFIGQVTASSIVVPMCEANGEIVDLNPSELQPDRRRSLLRELDLPSELAGKGYKDPVSKHITELIVQHQYDISWHYADEENLADIWKRAGHVASYLSSRPEQKLVVVAHGGIMKSLLAYLMFDNLDWPLEQKLQAYQAFTSLAWVDNTGIIPLYALPQEQHWQWLISYNRHLTSSFGYLHEEPGPDSSSDRWRRSSN